MILHFIFDKAPNPHGAHFIEIEDDEGHGIVVGKWRPRGDGVWELLVDTAELAEKENAKEQETTN